VPREAPIKRRGNRRYYQHHEVLLVRRIRELLYEQGYTISGARNKLEGGRNGGRRASQNAQLSLSEVRRELLLLRDVLRGEM